MLRSVSLPSAFRPAAARRGGGDRARRRLCCEPLEQRRLLTVLTVDSVDDTVAVDGAVTLREALRAANTDAEVGDAQAGSGADTIRFAASLHGETITLDGEQLEINSALSIEGPGADLLTIDADGRTRLFCVGPDAVASLADLTLTGGSQNENDARGASDGGGIYNAGQLMLSHVTLTGNRAPNNKGGGVSNWGSLAVVGSAVSGNSSDQAGGGISNNQGATARIRDSIVSGNVTTGPFGDGGGLAVGQDATLAVVNSVVVGNAVKSDVAEGGGGIFNSRGDVAVTNSTVAGNTVIGTFGGGGGIYNSAGSLTLNNSIIARNTTTNFWPDIYYPAGTVAGAHNLIGRSPSIQTDLVDGVDGNIIGTPDAPVDPALVRNPSDGGDGWGDDPGTPAVDESANDDYGDLQLQPASPAVDAGNNALAVGADGEALSTDILGHVRIHGGTVDMGAYEQGAAPVPSGAELSARLVLAPTGFDQPGTGEVAAPPENAAWIDEWASFYVEIWVGTPESSDTGVVSAQLDLTYNTDYFTAGDIEYGPGFDTLHVGTIDDAAGVVDDLGAGTFDTEVGDDGYALLARVRFDPTGADSGVPPGADGTYITPVDTGFGLGDAEVMLVGPAAAEVAFDDLPATELWPVMYDIDDDNRVGFGDFAFFASAFQKDVGQPGAESAWASDFDHSGRVDFGDFAFFAQNFQRSKDGGEPPEYHTSFPAAWRPDALTLQSPSTPPQDSAMPLTTDALDPILAEAARRLAPAEDAAAASVLKGTTVEIADLPGSRLGYAAGNHVWIDLDAAGYGWFVDATPGDDDEFATGSDSDDLVATADGPVGQRADLLTAVMHELGHVLGRDHAEDDDDLMTDTLPLATRRLPDDEAGPQAAAAVLDNPAERNPLAHDEVFTRW